MIEKWPGIHLGESMYSNEKSIRFWPFSKCSSRLRLRPNLINWRPSHRNVRSRRRFTLTSIFRRGGQLNTHAAGDRHEGRQDTLKRHRLPLFDANPACSLFGRIGISRAIATTFRPGAKRWLSALAANRPIVFDFGLGVANFGFVDLQSCVHWFTWRGWDGNHHQRSSHDRRA